MNNTNSVTCYGKCYEIEVLRRHKAPDDCPRLAIVGYQPNWQARELLRLCIESIQAFTPEQHELWVVDNASPSVYSRWLQDVPGINIVFNHTLPRPKGSFFKLRPFRKSIPYQGSFANAIALELVARIVDPASRYLMTFHMDTAVCRDGWLSYLLDQFDEKVGGVGFRLDTVRVPTLHILGALFDFQLIRKLKLSFMHRMPEYDVGDGISIGLKKAGYELKATENTYNNPEVIRRFPPESPFRELPVDRAVDDEGNVLFMHLGRGIVKSIDGIASDKYSPEDWCRFIQDQLLVNLRAGTDRKQDYEQ